jgi:alkylation response protein AidB-like acyl-CoA dehydrogenase
VNDSWPEDAVTLLDSFLEEIVDPLETTNADLLSDLGAQFDGRGICSPALLDLRRQVRTAAAARGLYSLCLPPSLGGHGAGAMLQLRLYLHLYARSGPARPLPYEAVATFTSGPGAGLVGLRQELISGLWRGVLSGEKVLCFAMSEPAPGPGAHAMATVAKEIRGGWSISGTKQWVSAGGYADYAVVYASTGDSAPPGSDGVSAFLVPLDAPGVIISRPTLLLGRIGGEEVNIVFDDVCVPASHVVGELHDGRAAARAGASARAVHAAGRAIGLSTWALERALDYAREAVVFGRVLATDAAVQSELARVATELTAARSAARSMAEGIDAGKATNAELMAVSSFVAEAWGRTYDTTMRVIGGDALRSDARLYDGWHQSMIVRAAEGTSGPMLSAIGRGLLGR